MKTKATNSQKIQKQPNKKKKGKNKNAQHK